MREKFESEIKAVAPEAKMTESGVNVCNGEKKEMVSRQRSR